jgi:hypothetical protein
MMPKNTLLVESLHMHLEMGRIEPCFYIGNAAFGLLAVDLLVVASLRKPQNLLKSCRSRISAFLSSLTHY